MVASCRMKGRTTLMKKSISNITASIFWDRTKDSLKHNFTGYIKYKTAIDYINVLFTEWKGVEKSYLREINALEAENDALTTEIESLNHQLTKRNNLVYLNASLHKELNYYKHYTHVTHIPVDGEMLSSSNHHTENDSQNCHIIQFPETIAITE